MLELQPKPQFSVVIPPKLLQEGYLVTFSSDWPSTHDAIREKTFRIDAVNQVPYDLSYILPESAVGTIYRALCWYLYLRYNRRVLDLDSGERSLWCHLQRE